MCTHRWAGIVALCLLLVLAGLGVAVVAGDSPNAAQPQEREVFAARSDNARLDLAAMALAGSDLPDGFFPTGLGMYRDADLVASRVARVSAITEDEVRSTGLRRQYEVQYFGMTGRDAIRSYISEYETAASARAGFDLLEDESRTVLHGTWQDRPVGRNLGDGPSETTTTMHDRGDGAGPSYGADVTFVVGRLVAGATLETLEGISDPEPPDPKIVEDLASVLYRRIDGLLDGTIPPEMSVDGIDLSLPPVLLPLSRVPSAIPVDEGYLNALEALGVGDAAAAKGGPYQGGYRRSVALYYRAPTDPAAAEFLVATTSVLDFATMSDARSLLDSAHYLPLSSPIMPIGEWERVGDPTIPGSNGIAAYRARSVVAGPFDSARVAFVVGNRLAVVEVAKAARGQDATALASLLAGQQAACLQAIDPCQQISLPGALQIPGPVPTSMPPVSSPDVPMNHKEHAGH